MPLLTSDPFLVEVLTSLMLLQLLDPPLWEQRGNHLTRINRSFSSEDQAEGSQASLAQAKAQRDVTSANATTSPKTVAAAMPNELIDKKEDLDEMDGWILTDYD